MPQTVPNRPTKGAVEPTVARNASPSCRRLWMSSMARWTLIETHELWSMFSVNAPSWCSLARIPESAMKRKALPVFSASAPSRSERDLKNERCAVRASLLSFRLSYSFVIRMYQLPMLMRTSTISVPRATQSPWSQSAPRPYGLSTVSFEIGAAAMGAGTGAGAAAEAVASTAAADAVAGAAAVGAEVGCACAVHGDSTTAQRNNVASVVAMRAGI